MAKEDCPNYRVSDDKNEPDYCLFRYWPCYFVDDDYKECRHYTNLKTKED